MLTARWTIRNTQSQATTQSKSASACLRVHALHFFLIRQRDHEKPITLVEADDAVGKQPHSVQKRIAAENQTYRRAD